MVAILDWWSLIWGSIIAEFTVNVVSKVRYLFTQWA